MDMIEAMNLARRELRRARFRYCMMAERDPETRWDGSQPIPLDGCNMLHLIMPLENRLTQVQSAVTFREDWCDLRTFPHPILVDPEDRLQCLRVMELLNMINSYVKAGGSFYLDRQTGDIAFWVRIPYPVLEAFPEALPQSLTTAHDFYEDCGNAIAQVVKGDSVFTAMAAMEERWGR